MGYRRRPGPAAGLAAALPAGGLRRPGRVALVQWAIGLRLGADIALLVALYTVAATRAAPGRGGRRGGARGGRRARRRPVRPGRRRRSARWSSCRAWWPPPTSSAPRAQTRRAYLGALVDRAARAERERDQQARLAATHRAGPDRPRAARHRGPQPDRGRHPGRGGGGVGRPDRRPPASAMGQVATTGRAALAEMRRLLGVLRTDPGDDPADLAPAPGLDGARRSGRRRPGRGLPVRLTVGGPPAAAGRGDGRHGVPDRPGVADQRAQARGRPVRGGGAGALGGRRTSCCRSPTTAGPRRPRAARARADRDAGAAGPVRRRAVGRPRRPGGWRVRARLPVPAEPA